MKTRVILALALFSCAGAYAQSTPEGLWRQMNDDGKPQSEILIKAGANGALSGVIQKALIDDPEPNCSKCTDDRKDKLKIGMEIIRGANKAADADVWQGGNILDPTNGKTYTLKMTPLDGGKKLQIRGYIGPFYRTQVWTRIQ